MQYILSGLIILTDIILTGVICGISCGSFVTMLCCLLASDWIQSLVHELGHMVGGLAGGYKFVSLCCRPVYIAVDKEQKLHIQGTICKGIHCAMAPGYADHPGCAQYIAGGCTANLLLSIMAVTGCMISSGITFVMCMQLAVTGFCKLLFNSIPCTMNGSPTDGYLLKLQWKKPVFQRDFNCYLRLYADNRLHRAIDIEDYHYERSPEGEGDCLLYYDAIQKLLSEISTSDAAENM